MGENSTKYSTACLVLVWGFLSVSLIIIALRLWSIRYTKQTLFLSNTFILMAGLIEIFHASFITLACHWGLGRHLQTLSSHDKIEATKWITIAQCPAILSSACGRISFALYLLRVARHVKREEAILKAVILVQGFVNLATVIQIYAQCHSHPSALWDPTVALSANCDSRNIQTIIGFVQSAINSVCDVVLTILPALLVWHLQVDLRKKLSLLALLTLSIFAFVASIAKTVAIRDLTAKEDLTFNFARLTMWATTENNIVIVASSIPTLRALITHPTSPMSGRTGSSSLGAVSTRTPSETNTSQHNRSWDGKKRFGSKTHSTINRRLSEPLHDNDSGEFILQPIGREGKNHKPGSEEIIKTTELHIRYSGGRAEEVN